MLTKETNQRLTQTTAGTPGGEWLTENVVNGMMYLYEAKTGTLRASLIALNENDPNVLSYARSYKGQSVLVVLNMSGTVHKVKLDLTSKGVRTKAAKTILSSFQAPSQVDPGEITVPPFGAWIGETE